MVLETPGVLDQLKTNPEETLKKLAIQATKELPTPALIVDRWIYRIVVIALGAVAIIAILGAVLLAFHGVGEKVIQVPDVVTALGAAAIGALSGLLAPSPTSKT